MPRSYSFDHFQVPAAEPRSRSLRRKDKQQVAGTRREAVEPHEEGIHYGRSHAQTQELFHAHARERQQAQTTGGAEHAGGKFAHERPVVESAAREAPPAREAKAPPLRGTAPIGALPRLEEQPPRGRLQDLLDEASRQLQVLQGGVGDATRAAVRLASLPMEVARLAARRLRLVHG